MFRKSDSHHLSGADTLSEGYLALIVSMLTSCDPDEAFQALEKPRPRQTLCPLMWYVHKQREKGKAWAEIAQETQRNVGTLQVRYYRWTDAR